MASLTLPTRLPNIDSFKDLIDQKDITIVGSSHNSFMTYLNQTEDSIMMVKYGGCYIICFFDLDNHFTTQGNK